MQVFYSNNKYIPWSESFTVTYGMFWTISNDNQEWQHQEDMKITVHLDHISTEQLNT